MMAPRRSYDHWYEWLGDFVKEAMKSWGLAAVIVGFGMAFVWWHGGAWVVAKAEAERTWVKTTSDLSQTMLLLSQAQARTDKRLDDADARDNKFCAQVSREHAEAADTLKQLLGILTELVQTLKNEREAPQT